MPRHLLLAPGLPRRLGLDPDVVSAARGRLDSSVATVNSAIEQLEELRNRVDMEEEEAAKADREVRWALRARVGCGAVWGKSTRIAVLGACVTSLESGNEQGIGCVPVSIGVRDVNPCIPTN